MNQEQSSTSAKILYKPVGIVSGLIAGAIATQVFHLVWRRFTQTATDDPPTALQKEYPLKEIVLAAALQGAIFSVVKALVARGGARFFERSTGEWPGD